MSLRLMTRGVSTVLRLKASNWRVMPEARSAADLICAVLSASRLPAGNSFGQDLRVAEDDGQQIVEVVSHAAGQTADSLHLLRLAQSLLERHPLGDVMHQRRHAEHSTRLVDERRVVPVTSDRAAVLRDVVIRVSRSTTLTQQRLPHLVHKLAML